MRFNELGSKNHTNDKRVHPVNSFDIEIWPKSANCQPKMYHGNSLLKPRWSLLSDCMFLTRKSNTPTLLDTHIRPLNPLSIVRSRLTLSAGLLKTKWA